MIEEDYVRVELLPMGNLLNNFNTFGFGYNYSISEDSSKLPGHFVLTSEHFKGKDINQIYFISNFIVKLILGLSNITFIDETKHDRIKQNGIWINGEQQHRIDTSKKYEIDKLLTDIPKSGLTRFDNIFLDLAFTNPFIKNILLHASRGWDLINLYKISDEIITFLKGNNDDILNYVTKSNSKAFGATSNNFDISGYEARHGSIGSNKTPKKVMTFSECSYYIRDLLQKVLEKYFNFKLLFFVDTPVNKDDLK